MNHGELPAFCCASFAMSNICCRTTRMGRPGRVPGIRELVIPTTPYIVPYRVQREAIQILRVYHGARRWPDSF
jgi:plasmid stabilization system protein ParE